MRESGRVAGARIGGEARAGSQARDRKRPGGTGQENEKRMSVRALAVFGTTKIGQNGTLTGLSVFSATKNPFFHLLRHFRPFLIVQNTAISAVQVLSCLLTVQNTSICMRANGGSLPHIER